MLCNSCCNHVHSIISLLQGGTVGLFAHGCEGNGCDYELRKRFDAYYDDLVQERRKKRYEQSQIENKDA